MHDIYLLPDINKEKIRRVGVETREERKSTKS